MANETTLETLVVELIGDVSKYLKALQQSQEATEKTAKEIESATKRIEAFTGSLQSFAKGALSALSSLGLATTLQGMFTAFSEMESATMRLTAAIEVNGREVASAMEGYKAFAESIEQVSLTSKGATLALLQQAESHGLMNKQAEQATRDAIALAAARGGEPAHYMRVAISMQEGNVQMARYILGMRGVKDESEIAARYQKLVASGTKIAAQEMQTAQGQLTLMGRELKEVSREIGKMVSEMLLPLVKWIREAVAWWKEWSPAMRQASVMTVGLLAAIGPAVLVFNTLKAAVVTTVGVIVAGGKAFYSAAASVHRHTMALTANAIAATRSAQANATAGKVAAGGAGAAAAGAGRGGAIGAVVTGALVSGFGILSAIKALGGINAEQERLNELMEDAIETSRRYDAALLKRESDAVSATLKEVEGLQYVEDQQARLNKEVEKSEAVEKDRMAAVEAAKKSLRELKDPWRLWAQRMLFIDDKSLAAAEERVESLKNRLAGARENTDRLRDALKQVTPSAFIERQLGDLKRKLTEELPGAGYEGIEKQLATLQSKAKGTIPFEQMQALRDLSDEIKARELTGGMVKTADELERTADTFAMAGRAAAQFKKELDAVMAGADIMSDAFVRARFNIARLDVLDKVKPMMAEGKKLTEEFATPTEKLAKRQAELQRMFDLDAISADTYAKALLHAEKQLTKLQATSNKGIGAGTLEAIEFMRQAGEAQATRMLLQPEARTAGTAIQEALALDTAERNKLQDAGNKVLAEIRDLLREQSNKPIWDIGSAGRQS
jgi:hypothetical protein